MVAINNNNRTIKVVASLRLFAGENMRQMPFFDGYRPLFQFANGQNFISGSISDVPENGFYPNTEGEVTITFLRGMISNEALKKGSKFRISEGGASIGEGKIIRLQ